MYVSGNRRFHYSLYILMKYVALFPDNPNRIFNSLVVVHRRSPVKRSLINMSNIYKFFFCNPKIILVSLE